MGFMSAFLTCGIKQVKEEGPFINFLHPDYLLCNIFWRGANTTHSQENVVLQKVTGKNLYKDLRENVKLCHSKSY